MTDTFASQFEVTVSDMLTNEGESRFRVPGKIVFENKVKRLASLVPASEHVEERGGILSEIDTHLDHLFTAIDKREMSYGDILSHPTRPEVDTALIEGVSEARNVSTHKVLTEYISNNFITENPVRFKESTYDIKKKREDPLSKEEFKCIKKNLRALGYIG